VESSSIIFLTIDKIAGRETRHGPDVSGKACSAISCRSLKAPRSTHAMARAYGHPVHRRRRVRRLKPSDMIPELQGGFDPGGAKSLTVEDFIRILKSRRTP
jgi:ATP-dependent protease HslVU (ClpYQ) ATPase subunit